jgi:hypothetical protein
LFERVKNENVQNCNCCGVFYGYEICFVILREAFGDDVLVNEVKREMFAATAKAFT